MSPAAIAKKNAKVQKAIDLSTRLALTTTEAGRLLGISGASVRNLIRTGKLHGINFGTGMKSESFIVSIESLRDFLGGKTGSPQA